MEDEHPELDQPVNFIHHVHVQDDLAYLAYWDAGGRILDVSDPSDPIEVSAFGQIPTATEPAEGDYDKMTEEPGSEFSQRVLGLPGNAHTSTPSPDGKYVYLGEETYIGEPGGIRVFDVTDLDNPEEVTRIDPPSDVTSEYAHFYEVTENRLYSSWIDGGIRIFDVTNPAEPEELARYNPDGFSSGRTSFARSTIISTYSEEGVVFLHDDRGDQSPPTSSSNET